MRIAKIDAKKVVMRIAERKLPKGAVRFVRKTENIDWNEVDFLRQKLELSDLFILHGTAVEINGKATIVCGPSAIGKSTMSRAFEKKGFGKMIDDGAILVGRDSKTGQLYLIPSGWLKSTNVGAIISKIARNLLKHESAFVGNLTEAEFRKRDKIGEIISKFSRGIGTIAAKNQSNERFELAKIPLQKCVFIQHPKFEDVFSEKIISGHEVKKSDLDELGKQFSELVKVARIQPSDSELRKKIWKELIN